MKNRINIALTAFALLLLFQASAQKPTRGTTTRCFTMERITQQLNKNPGLRTMVEQRTKQPVQHPASITNRISGTVTIPVVVHIVLPNPYIVTDADIQTQLNMLNTDYAGLNADSTNIPPEFQAVRGHSQIQFCLAKRTPSGQLTSGVERRASAVGSDVNATQDPVKYSSLGGLDSWDPSSYLNYWIGTDASGQGILGYAEFPASTTDPVSADGVFINYKSWGNNPCYVYSSFNKGRTAVHETGHYLGLLHIWGDDGNSCTGDDFEDISSVSASCVLPTGLYNPAGQGNTASDVGDTPNQGNSTSGCPGTLIKTDACSSTSPGVMYQDYMDYSDDGCLTMFTKKQVERMEWVLANCRSSLLTSLGCQPPASPISLDAAPLQSVNPGGFELSGCTSTILYSSVLPCPGPISPKFRVVNNGLTTLTSLTVGYRLNNGAPVTQTISVNLPLGGTTVVSFAAVAVPAGANTFKFFTSNPNGSTDQVPSNDTLAQTLTVLGSVTLPLVEGFESTTFPPANWAIDNYNNDGTWTRKTPGRSSTGEMFIDNYNLDASNTKDDFKSSRFSTAGYDSVIVSFDVAYKNYPQVGFYDTLVVLVTPDCGATYQEIYRKYGPTLATAGSSSSEYTTPASSDWRTERIVLSGTTLSTGQLSVVFRNISEYGNDLHIDNINISGKIAAATYRDLTVTNIITPAAVNCSASLSPVVTVKNTGTAIITSFDVGYQIGTSTVVAQTFTQTLNPGDSTTFNLASTTAPISVNLFTAFTANPVSTNGTGDDVKANDTLTKQFSVLGTQAAPLTEGFESLTFPPANWGLNNPDRSFTWQRYSNGKSSTGSAYVNTYNYATAGQIDELYSPMITYSNVDSVKLTFDVAATYRSVSAMDTLSVLVTTDCGSTFTTVYQKWGDGLATVTSPQTFEFLPTTSSQWRNESIDLTSFVAQSPIAIVFRVSNSHGNNIFVDNVNLTTKKYPEALRRKGFLILPTAFRSGFAIWHYQQPTTLKYINVYTATGQLVYSQQFNGNADKYITVDMSNKASGSYLVHLGYEDSSKDVSQWVIKY